MPKKKIPEFTDLMQEQGAFGRIQFVFYFMICAGINSVGWEQYNYYLTAEPTWYCSYTDKYTKLNMTYTFDSVQPLEATPKDEDREKLPKKEYPREICYTDYWCNKTGNRAADHPEMIFDFAEFYVVNASTDSSVNKWEKKLDANGDPE